MSARNNCFKTRYESSTGTLLVQPHKCCLSHSRTHYQQGLFWERTSQCSLAVSPSWCRDREVAHRQVPCQTQCATAAAITRDAPPALQPEKEVWIQTKSKEVLTAALEAGVTTFVFEKEGPDAALLHAWRKLAKFKPLVIGPAGNLCEPDGTEVGHMYPVRSAGELKQLEAAALAGRLGSAMQSRKAAGVVVLDALNWKVIPAENLVAMMQSLRNSRLFAVAGSATDARTMLEALEVGTSGVLLRTASAAQVRELANYLAERRAAAVPQLQYSFAKITCVTAVASCDRVCCDLACLLRPGEGLLTGSYARGLFLVHSECEDTGYIASRPFRVNAGAVHAYVQVPKGQTKYLCELTTGTEVVVANPAGQVRTVVVGRTKVEHRPMILVKAQCEDGDTVTILLQNAETVKLVGPTGVSTEGLSKRTADCSGQATSVTVLSANSSPGSQNSVADVVSDNQSGNPQRQAVGTEPSAGITVPQTQPSSEQLTESPVLCPSAQQLGGSLAFASCISSNHSNYCTGDSRSWQTLPAPSLAVGDVVYVLRQGAARHFGMAIQEQIVEK